MHKNQNPDAKRQSKRYGQQKYKRKTSELYVFSVWLRRNKGKDQTVFHGSMCQHHLACRALTFVLRRGDRSRSDYLCAHGVCRFLAVVYPWLHPFGCDSCRSLSCMLIFWESRRLSLWRFHRCHKKRYHIPAHLSAYLSLSEIREKAHLSCVGDQRYSDAALPCGRTLEKRHPYTVHPDYGGAEIRAVYSFGKDGHLCFYICIAKQQDILRWDSKKKVRLRRRARRNQLCRPMKNSSENALNWSEPMTG